MQINELWLLNILSTNYAFTNHLFYIYIYIRERERERGARGVMVIVLGNGHGYEFKSSTRLIAFHIALIPLRKV